MKKLLPIYLALGLFFSSNAIAKTEGNYVTVNFINTLYEETAFNRGTNDEQDFSFGLNYKYAFNYNKIFLAPSIFFDNNNVEVSYALAPGVAAGDKLKYSYGAKLDLGYDITDKIAAYVSYGYAEGRIEASITSNSNNSGAGSLNNLSQEGEVMGVGLSYYLEKNLGVNFAYEVIDFNKTPTSDRFANLQVEARVLKLGVSYNF